MLRCRSARDARLLSQHYLVRVIRNDALQMHASKNKLFWSSLPQPVAHTLSSRWVCVTLTALVAAACYWNSLQGQFVHDDIFAIRDNKDVQPSTPIANLFKNDFWGKPMSSVVSHKSYRPLTILTFRMNYALHGLNPWGYHVVNVLLHMAATVLFGWLCMDVVFGCADLSLLAALLFATHPVHTEAVTGIVGRAELLACIFFLLAFMAYRSSLTEEKRLLYLLKLLLCIACGSIAMLFKEHGITVFGVCFAYDVLIASRGKLERAWRTRTLRDTAVLPLVFRGLLVAGAVSPLLVFRLSLLHGHLPHFSAHDNPASFDEHLQTRILSYCYLLYFNAKLLVAPITLCYDWQMSSIPLVESWSDPRNFGSLVFVICLIALTTTSIFGEKSMHKSVTMFGLLLTTIPFLPASNLLFRVGFVVAERILYIPSMGYCILVVQGMVALSHRGRSLDKKAPSSPTFYLTLAVVVVFAVKTVSRNRVWLTRESLFRSGLETVPHNAKIHYNYANFLRDAKRTDEAIEHYRTAVRLAPDHAVSHNNLGTLLDLTEAEFHFKQAVKHNPQHYRAYFNLGRNLERQGRVSEAEDAFRQSLSIEPDYHDALMSLATMMADGGRVEEGWPLMTKAAAVAPNNANVHNNLGAYLLRMGKRDEAIETYQKVIQLDPRHSTAMTSLGRVYRSMGQNDRAEEVFRKSLSIKRDASTLHFLGALYHNTGRYKEAADAFGEALQLEPTKIDTLCSYGQSLIQLGERENALKLFTEALKTSPISGCVHLGLANIYTHRKLLDKALEHSSKAVELGLSEHTANAEAFHIHGGILKDLGRLNEAEESYRKAVSLAPRMSAAYMNLGAVLHMKKNYQAARKEYEAALRLDSRNKLLQENLRKLERAENNAKLGN